MVAPMTNASSAARAASPIQAYLERLHERFAGLASGQVASYIPELAKADPDLFGIVIATVDGQVYEVGATRQPFTIQSISKPLVYGVALEDRGPERVLQAIGVEPSGDAFNSISLEPGTGRSTPAPSPPPRWSTARTARLAWRAWSALSRPMPGGR